jgi:hypothetical protein
MLRAEQETYWAERKEYSNVIAHKSNEHTANAGSPITNRSPKASSSRITYQQTEEIDRSPDGAEEEGSDDSRRGKASVVGRKLG